MVSAGLAAPGKVSGTVLDAGWQAKVLFISQTPLAARLAPAPGMALALWSAMMLLSATIVTLSQHRQKLSMKSHGRGGVSQFWRTLWLGLKIGTFRLMLHVTDLITCHVTCVGLFGGSIWKTLS